MLCILALTGCKARKDYPEPNQGWHSGNYSAVYGRLQKIGGATADDPPTWTIRFGTGQEPYQGQFALYAADPRRLTGYAGGEAVEVKGHLLDEPTTDAFNGRWYVVDSIQLWTTYRQ
ncbi:MAG TPA: hypothetical protein VGN88_09985 [Phycisphaerae bacterium]